jgi:hypothetical protein
MNYNVNVSSINAPVRFALRISILVFAILSLPASALEITHRKVTWTITGTPLSGTYANGDPWVVGPVTITAISPQATNADGWWQHGTQVNAAIGTGPQGFDSSMPEGGQGPGYSAVLNVDPGHTKSPLVLTEGTVIKSISRSTRPSVRGTGSRPQLVGMEYLTVVRTAPPPGAFRPPPVGTDKRSAWTTKDLDHSILRNLPALAGAPEKSVVENWFLRPWPSFILDNQGRWTHPMDNMPEYGRDFGRRLGQGGLVLHTNIGDKTTLYIRMVQIGIDTHATVKDKNFFTGFGAINSGWKWPVLLAGLGLKDEGIKTVASGGITTPGSAPNANRLKFAFDRQTWYVLPSDVGRVMYSADGRKRETYREEHVGLPEWGEQHWKQAVRDGSNWNAYYRNIAFAGDFSGILSGVLTKGGTEAWGWPATIEYLDRYVKDYPGGAVGAAPNNLSAWEGAMYSTYRNIVPPVRATKPEPPRNLRIPKP